WSSRLSWATSNQVARVQVTTNSGLTWQDLWSLAGNGSGQTVFDRNALSLAPFAGMEIQLRFLYDNLGGSYYNQTGPAIGWLIDDIDLNGCEQMVNAVVRDVTGGTRFDFVPTAATNYLLRVRAQVGNHYLDWGPPLLAVADASPFTVRIASTPVVVGSRAG